MIRGWWSRFTHICSIPDSFDGVPPGEPDPPNLGQQYTCDCGLTYTVTRGGWAEVPYERRVLGVEFKYWADRAPWAR